MTITKLLVANRGEIAIRAFRAAYELGLRTVAVYTHADRSSIHRLKADEAYEIGDPARPLAGYLDVDALVRTAVEVGADAIYPGYGFLSESPLLARACRDAGVTFVGPPSEVLELTGDKIRAKHAATDAGVLTLAASPPLESAGEARASAEAIGFPVFVKAAAGGGGRGMRRVDDPADLEAAVETAMREAQGAFGDPTVFLEQAVDRPRHIEVQILAGADGQVIHLFERDCSVQRRHQKVVEIAPAPNLDVTVRQAILDDAVRFAEAVGYRNAGTIEFLLGADGRHVFIEMNPRVQVEHTVTEEVTGVDIVQSQMRIADGATLSNLNITQDSVSTRGTAIQCRITTEDPAQGFRPDTGTILAYRSASGPGIRLDSGSAFVGAEVSPYFDSMLVKVTARGQDLPAAARRADRALAEFRIRGVATNMGFLRALLAEPDFLAGELHTNFIDDRPHLTSVQPGQDRATRLLRYLADVTVNQPHGSCPPRVVDPRTKLPPLPVPADQVGSRRRLQELGPERFVRELRSQQALAVTDTTMRDAHQSLLATRMRTIDMLGVGRHVAGSLPQLFSMEVWGGATFDVALRFLSEDPWERLAALREAIPNICFQMLLRGKNAVGYGSYPDKVVRAFVAEAASTGIDIFRIFDAFNSIDQMRPAIQAVRETGAIAEGTICYTSDVSDPAERLYTLDYYLRAAEDLVAAGVHMLCIKDMAGLLRAPAATRLVSALRSEFELPVHLHTHDTAGGQLATYLAAIDAGVDAVDGAAAPLSGMTSQPSLGAIVAATDHTARQTGLDLDALIDLEPYWEAVRALYRPFEAGLAAPTGAVYRHEIPGGQLSNLRQQAVAMGLGDRFEQIGELYARVNGLLGNLIKVTPSSKVVGDLALFLASSDITVEQLAEHPDRYDLPGSVLQFLAGDLGVPAGGWPEPFRTKALTGRDVTIGDEQLDQQTLQALAGSRRQQALTRLLFPGPAEQYTKVLEDHGEVSVIPTREFLYGLEHEREVEIQLEAGVRLLVDLEAISEPDARGRRTVHIKLNGQSRPVEVIDRTLNVTVAEREHADPDIPGHVAAPLTGVVTVTVEVGDKVDAGQRVATVEAMKMESSINAPITGTVERIAVPHGSPVEPGDLILVLK